MDRFDRERLQRVESVRVQALETERPALVRRRPPSRQRCGLPSSDYAGVLSQAPRRTRATWERLTTLHVAHDDAAEGERIARVVQARLMCTESGVDLIQDLTTLIETADDRVNAEVYIDDLDPANDLRLTHPGTARVQVDVHFLNRAAFPDPRARRSANGYFEPRRFAARYSVFVAWRAKLEERDAIELDGSRVGFTRPESAMTRTLFHELLHVWFARTFTAGTGHRGDDRVLGGPTEVHDVFRHRLRRMVDTLGRLERHERDCAADRPRP